MHEFIIFYSFWFLTLHTAFSSLFSPSLILYHSLTLSLWPSQNSNEIKWSLICMHLQNIACAVFAVKGIKKRVVVVMLVGVYVLPHWHQTILWYGNGRAREEWLLTEALFGCRPRSIPPFLHLSMYPYPCLSHTFLHTSPTSFPLFRFIFYCSLHLPFCHFEHCFVGLKCSWTLTSLQMTSYSIAIVDKLTSCHTMYTQSV